jgi:importin-9
MALKWRFGAVCACFCSWKTAGTAHSTHTAQYISTVEMAEVLQSRQTMQTLLERLLSSDNNVRIQAELDFKHWMEINPDDFVFLLIQTAQDNTIVLALRQSALLHLKRVIPLYWSLAFDKFVGPNTISQDVKKIIRESLIKLIGDNDSRVRSSASYAIVQIAAVDYPDEWPDLLNILYATTVGENSSMYEIVGSLSVLQEIFDDVVTDEQLFEGSVGIEVLNTCESLLLSPKYNIEVKVETLRLLRSLCQSFLEADFSVGHREQFNDSVIPQIYELLLNISRTITQQNATNQLFAWDLKHELYQIISLLLNNMGDLLNDHVMGSFEAVFNDLTQQEHVFVEALKTDLDDIIALRSLFIDVDEFHASQRERKEPTQFLTFTIAREIEVLQILIELKHIDDRDTINRIADLLLRISILSATKMEDYISNFNEFVTDESGLNVEISVRDNIRELLSDMNAHDNTLFIDLFVQKLNNYNELDASNFLQFEAIIYLLSCCFDNDDTIVGQPSFNLEQFLSSSLDTVSNTSLLSGHENMQLFIARVILMIPKFLFKFSAFCKSQGVPSFNRICLTATQLDDLDDMLIIKSSILISLQYFNYLIRAKEFSDEIQRKLLEIVLQLAAESDEDTNLLLLEVLTIIISINSSNLTNDSSTIKLILSIGFKYESNFTLNNTMYECIDDLIKNITQEKYINLISFVFPFLLNMVSAYNGTYNSQIDLGFQVLTSFLKNEDGTLQLTPEIFNPTFSVISKFINVCEDDELLQSSSETLVALIKMSSELCDKYTNPETNENGIQMILKNVSQLLSPSMSDRAILNLGDLVTILLEKFNHLINDYIEDILKAVTIRLVQAKEVPTIENMILIFNMLTISQPLTTLNFLKSFQIEGQPALSKVLPIWFQAFEVMRGYNSILHNVHAFIEIYKCNDNLIQQYIVDGDALPHQVEEGIIVTRSMAKRMPIQFEKIPADAKIIRLLLDELKNEMTSGQHSHHSNSHLHDDADVDDNDGDDDNNDDDEGWEDMEDMAEPSFDQLKSYVDEDGSVKRASDGRDDNMKEMLITFFKQCTTQNTSNFEHIYNQYLTDSQKNLLKEYLIFTN